MGEQSRPPSRVSTVINPARASTNVPRRFVATSSSASPAARPAELLNGPHPPMKLKARADCDDDFIAVRLRRGRAAEWALSPERTVAVLYARPRGYKPTITAETCALRRRPFVIAHASDTDIPRLGLPPTAVCQRLLYELVPYVLNLHCHSTFGLLEYKLREENTAAQNT